jgi:hypothetical protein
MRSCGDDQRVESGIDDIDDTNVVTNCGTEEQVHNCGDDVLNCERMSREKVVEMMRVTKATMGFMTGMGAKKEIE